jgi:protocatechuate 3,4-dioxygenase beta subunit
MMWMTAVLVVIFCAQEPRQTADPGAAPAMIAGRVTDKGTGGAILRAVVFVRPLPQGSATQVFTDDVGHFELSKLAPGRYVVSVTAGEFLATHARYDGGVFELRPGETRELNIALPRALAISGRVIDEDGVPLARVGLRGRNLSTGYAGDVNSLRRTDDRGVFRLFGLPPGRYVVCAQVFDSITIGKTVVQKKERFVETCYPSAAEEQAQPIALIDSDVEAIEIRMQRRRTYTISGTVVDASGTPVQPTTLTLWRIKSRGSSGSGQRTSGSAFTISDVAPGKYVVSAQLGESAPDTVPKALGGVPVEITSEDVSGLLVMMKAAGRARGRITFDEGSPADLNTANVRVEPTLIDRPGISMYAFPAPVSPDLTFQLDNVNGPHVMRVSGLPAEWIVKSIRYRNREILDTPAELDGDPRSDTMDITLTRRAAELSGRVLDERGNPAVSARVHLFPADRARWEGWLRGAARSDASGAFRVRNLVDGDYFLTAISANDQEAIASAMASSPTSYERLSTIAERITLLESDHRVIDLRVTPIPQEWKR